MKRTLVFFLVALICCGIPVPGSGQSTAVPDKKQNWFSEEKATGFYNVTSFTPVTFNGDLFNGVQTICGYKIIPQLAVGGGIGYEGFTDIPTYDNFKTNLSVLPVFVDIRYTALKGKVSPVVALDAGYKILLNNPATQVVLDTSYYPVFTVDGRSAYADYDVYKSGGFFITAGIGMKVRLYGRLSALIAGEYSFWTITGDRYSSKTTQLLGNTGVWANVSKSESITRTLAYVHMFQIRVGIGF
ncbi:MAG: hypothetical protein NTU98_08965 [Bacteroidetes bacterium]|nr:hypothetical protein [Bacteroidota bacterium]